MNRVVAFLLAVVTVYVVGVLAYSQLNLAALVELGMPVTAEVRLSTFVHDLLGMTQIFLPVVIISLLLALPVANLIVRKVPQLTVIGYISAGFMAMLVMNTILSQAVGGTALHLAGGKVKKKMAKFAAALMEANEEDLIFENGKISVKGAPSAGTKEFSEVAAYAYVPVPLPEGLEPGLSEEAFFEPSNNTYPFGCHIAMLEVDRDTGEPTLLKFVAVDDAGNLINPLIVEGQIHGGLAQGIGQAMIEEVAYNEEDGQPLTGSFMDYAVPRATDFPRFELDNTVTPTPVNPLGAKGVGEAGTIGSTPCIVSAAVDALSGCGVTHIDMMLRPEKLWRIIHGSGGQS